MQAPIPVTRKIALDLIADAIADHILAQIARDNQAQAQKETAANAPAAKQQKTRGARVETK